jgi:transcriptional pleiotropic regulator of transition state genes
MKSTGIVRKVDDLGRVVLPIELRRTLSIAEKDSLEIYVDGEQVILKKYEPACIFCGNAADMIHFHGKNVCRTCAAELSSTAVRAS